MNRSTKAVFCSLALAVSLVPGIVRAAGNVKVASHVKRTPDRIFVDVSLDGDREANAIVITRGRSADEIIVAGVNGTTVNGLADVPLAILARDNLHIDLGDGNDSILLDHTSLAGDVQVRLREGKDSFGWNGGSVRSLWVAGDAGQDEIIVVSLAIERRLMLEGNAGTDSLGIAAVSVGEKGTLIDGGLGDDAILIDGLDQAGPFALDAEQGDDGVAVLDTYFGDKATIDLGRQNDEVTLQDVTADGLVKIDGGEGVDTYVDAGGNVFNAELRLEHIDIK